jgi:hypothetical protein
MYRRNTPVATPPKRSARGVGGHGTRQAADR